MSMGSIDKGDGASIRSFGTQATRTQGNGEEGLRGAGTEIAAVLFGLNEDWLANKLRELQGVCTEQAALDDFKVCLISGLIRLWILAYIIDATEAAKHRLALPLRTVRL
jgi:hypothetical protein